MILYHVTNDTQLPDVCMFMPRVPESAAFDENKNIPRICMCPSIELCLQAMPCDSRCDCLSHDGRIKVYSGEFEKEKLIGPQELYDRNYVPDALENREYWVTQPVRLASRTYIVKNFQHEHAVAWTCVDKDTVEQIILSMCRSKEETMVMKTFIHETDSSVELYKKAAGYYDRHGMWEQMDDLWEKITEDPKSQKTVITGLELSEEDIP